MTLVDILITGLVQGFATVIGSFFGTKYVLAHLQKPNNDEKSPINKIKEWYVSLWK